MVRKLIKFLRSMKNNLFAHLFPNWFYQHRRKNWQKQWSSPDYSPDWRITGIPKELQAAVESEWFLPHSSVLDIGCGSGEITAWLAQNGFKVVGIDFAQSAIEKAKSKYQSISGLELRNVDICQEKSGLESSQFDVFIDRGCLHGISQVSWKDYARTVVSCSKSGARFLIFYGIDQNGNQNSEQIQKQRQKTLRDLEKAFSSFFEVVQVQETLIERSSPNGSVLGLAVWMIRK